MAMEAPAPAVAVVPDDAPIPIDDPAADAALVDLSSERSGWGYVEAPVVGRQLRWVRGGKRFFVELDAVRSIATLLLSDAATHCDERLTHLRGLPQRPARLLPRQDVIAPLRRTLMARNSARDLRRRVVGFQLLERESPDTKQRRQFIVEIDALVAMLYQERAALASRMTESPEEQEKLKEIQRWAQWAHVHCCHQPLYQLSASHGLWSAAAAGPPPAVQQYPQITAPPLSVPGCVDEAPPDPELVPLSLELDLDDGALSMLPTADEFGNAPDVASSVPVAAPQQENWANAASGKRRRTDRPRIDGVASAPVASAGVDDEEDDQEDDRQSAELQELGEVAMATLRQLAQMQIRNSPDTSGSGDGISDVAAADTKAKDESASDVGPPVVVAATTVTTDATLEGACEILTPVEAFSAHLDRVEQLPVACARLGSSASKATIELQEVAWAREMVEALTPLESDSRKDADLEGRALACLRARQWDVSSAMELFRRFCLFRLQFGLGTARSREMAAPFVRAGLLRCAGGKDHSGRPIWHITPGCLQQAFAGAGLSRAEIVHHFVIAFAGLVEGALRRYPEGQKSGCRLIWDGRGFEPKLVQPAMLKFVFRAFTQLLPIRVEGVVTLDAPWTVKKILTVFFSMVTKSVPLEHVKDVAELPGALGCGSDQLDETLGGTRVYDHQAFAQFALGFS